MQTYFSGRMLSADALTAEQSYGPARHWLPTAAADSRPPASSLTDAVVASLPPSILDEVALNPQPLPPRESVGELDTDVPSGTEVAMIELQSMIAQRAQAVQMSINMVAAFDHTTSSTIDNLGK